MTFFGEGNWPFRPAGRSALEAPDVAEDRLARRALLLFAAGLVVVGLGGLAYVLLWGGSADGPTLAASATQEIGPLPGAEISAYTKERTAALDQASGERLAVVSLAAYADEARARAAVGSLTVTGLLAAPPGAAPSAVTGSLAEWADAQSAVSKEERNELVTLLPTVDEPQFRDFYAAEVERLNKVIEGVSPNGPLVFAVVVRAPAEALRKLINQPGVRLVDIGSGPELADGAAVRGLRPEETAKADDPPTRPL